MDIDPDISDDTRTADSSKNEPDEVTLEAVMSDVCAASSAMTSAAASGLTRSAAALDRLYSLKRDRTPLRLTTPLRVYPRMLLRNVTVTSEAGQCHGFTATITFREVPAGDDKGGGKPTGNDNASSAVRRGRAEPDAVSTSVAKRLLEKISSRVLA